jgi:hypothetical protein
MRILVDGAARSGGGSGAFDRRDVIEVDGARSRVFSCELGSTLTNDVASFGLTTILPDRISSPYGAPRHNCDLALNGRCPSLLVYLTPSRTRRAPSIGQPADTWNLGLLR